jgi:hypothetical protein
MQRGWSSFADTRQKNQPTSSIRTRVFSSFSRQCVGGDVHPVGVRRHLNDPLIFGTRLVVTFSSARAETSFGGGRRLRSEAEPASLDTASPDLNGPRNCEWLLVEFFREVGRFFLDCGGAGRRASLARQPLSSPNCGLRESR